MIETPAWQQPHGEDSKITRLHCDDCADFRRAQSYRCMCICHYYGQPVPQRAIEQKPVELPYLKALSARESLGSIRAYLLGKASSLICQSGTQDCRHCQIESLADDCAYIELLLRGEG